MTFSLSTTRPLMRCAKRPGVFGPALLGKPVIIDAGEFCRIPSWTCHPRTQRAALRKAQASERGGYCRIAADLPAGDTTVRQLYLSDTAVLLTRFMSRRGVGEVVDFMAPLPCPTPTDRHRLVRVVRVVRGSLPFTLTCRPRFDYGRASHTLAPVDDRSVVFRGPGTDLHLQSTEPVTLQADDGDITAHFSLVAGEIAVVVMTSVAGDGPAPTAPSVN